MDFPPTQPNWYMACMAFESSRTFRSDIHNPNSSATGLIQFLESTANSLGTTTGQLASMTPEKQLDYVWYYFKATINQRGPLNSLADCYMAILNPVAVEKPDSYVMWISGTSSYAANSGLDTNSDHQITKAEAASRVYSILDEGLRPGNAA